MPKPLMASIQLCLSSNGINTPMEEVTAKFMKDKLGNIYLQEFNGKRQWQYNDQMAFHTKLKDGSVKILAYYDRFSNLQLNPNEIMGGMEFNRVDIKNAIGSQLNAERRLRDRVKADQNNKLFIGVAIIILIASVMMLAAVFIFSNAITHTHITVSLSNSTYTANGVGIGSSISNIGHSLASIP